MNVGQLRALLAGLDDESPVVAITAESDDVAYFAPSAGIPAPAVVIMVES